MSVDQFLPLPQSNRSSQQNVFFSVLLLAIDVDLWQNSFLSLMLTPSNTVSIKYAVTAFFRLLLFASVGQH